MVALRIYLQPDQKLMQLLSTTDDTRTTGFAFLVFVMRESATYQPFVYSYTIDAGDAMGFLPTMHFHPRVAPSPNTKSNSSKKRTRKEKEEEEKEEEHVELMVDDWDHEIYVLGVETLMLPHELESSVDSPVRLRASCLAQCSLLAGLDVSSSTLVAARDVAYKIVIRGSNRNVDVQFPLRRSICFCDVCRREILQGYHYKCFSCSNWDMCQDCHDTGRLRHPHPLVELRNAEHAKQFEQVIASLENGQSANNEEEINGVKRVKTRMIRTSPSSKFFQNGTSSSSFPATIQPPLHPIQLPPAAIKALLQTAALKSN